MAQTGMISIGFKVEAGKDGLQNLIVDAQGLQKALEATVSESDKLSKKYLNLAGFTTSLKGFADSAKNIASTLSGLTAESGEFSAAMRAANTMAGKDAEGFSQLKGEVASLASEIPIARDELANGLYQVISNGVPEDNWIDYLNASARSAVGGIADINKVVGVTATVIKNYGLLVRVFTHAMNGGKMAAIAFKVALRGLMIASGIGIAIWALTEAIQAFSGTSDKAADAADRLTSSEERLRRQEETAKELKEAEAEAYKNAASSIETYKAKIESFNGTKEDESKLVGELNSTYGDTMGYFSSLQEWYKALVANSKAYCDQMVAEAKTRKMANQIAELDRGEALPVELRDHSLHRRHISRLQEEGHRSAWTERHSRRLRHRGLKHVYGLL